MVIQFQRKIILRRMHANDKFYCMAGILSQAVNSPSQLYGPYTEESSTKAYSNNRRYGENTEALGF